MTGAMLADQARSLLATLQHADSFFPAGSLAFSWGLEGLVADAMLGDKSQIIAFVCGQIEHRWGSFDRPFLVAAWDAADNIESIAVLDRAVEAMILAEELREGSRRAGNALLAAHTKIGTPGVERYRAAVQGNDALGHLPIVQGFVWRASGLGLHQAEAVSAHSFCIAVLGAALRLGLIGHVHAQQALLSARDTIASMLSVPAPDWDESHSFTPAIEIAAMRHEVQSSRLFAN